MVCAVMCSMSGGGGVHPCCAPWVCWMGYGRRLCAHGRGAILVSARTHFTCPQAADIQRSLLSVVEKIELIQKDLKGVCQERAHYRKEIDHYLEKIKKLAIKVRGGG